MISETASEPFNIEKVLHPEEEYYKYIPGELQKNESGLVYRDFEKNLKPWLYGLFHAHVIKDFQDIPNQNHIYKGSSLNTQVDLLNLKKLVNAFFVKYGKDDNDSGGFGIDDIQAIKEDFWTGRKWLSKKYKHPVMISYTIKEGVVLAVWKTE